MSMYFLENFLVCFHENMYIFTKINMIYFFRILFTPQINILQYYRIGIYSIVYNMYAIYTI